MSVRFSNLLRLWREKAQGKVTLDSYPVTLQLALTDFCKIRCLMCYRTPDMYRGAEIPRAYLEQAVEFFPYLYQLKPYFFGETFTYSDFEGFFNRLDRGTNIFIATSLQELNAGHLQALRKRQGVINVSLDAATPGLYRKIRQGDLKSVLDNVRLLKQKTPLDIWFSMVTFKLNLPDVRGFLELAAEYGVTAVVFSPLCLAPGEKPQENTGLVELDRKEAEFLAKETARSARPFAIYDLINARKILPAGHALKTLWRKGRQGNWSEIIYKGSRRMSRPLLCPKPWEELLISGDGKVRVCCEQRGFFGDLNSQSLKEIWNCQAIRQMRSDIVAGRRPQACRACHFFSGNRQWFV